MEVFKGILGKLLSHQQLDASDSLSLGPFLQSAFSTFLLLVYSIDEYVFCDLVVAGSWNKSDIFLPFLLLLSNTVLYITDYSVVCSVLCLLLLLHPDLSLDALQIRIGMMMTMSKTLNHAGLFLTLQCSAELRQIFTPLKLFSDMFCSATNESQIHLCVRHWNSPLDQNTKKHYTT